MVAGGWCNQHGIIPWPQCRQSHDNATATCRECRHRRIIPIPDKDVPDGWFACFRPQPFPPNYGQLSAIIEATGKINTAAVLIVSPDFGCIQFEADS